MKVFEVRLFAAALLGAALFSFIFVGCTDSDTTPAPEPECQSLAECLGGNGGGKTDDPNDGVVCGGLNVDVNNGDNNEDSCNNDDVNNDVPDCAEDADCADSEVCGDSECVDECHDVSCDNGFACEAGSCVDPCAEWRWLRPNERAWHCPEARDGDIGLYLEARSDGCFMGADMLFNGSYLPQDEILFFPEQDKFRYDGGVITWDCVPM